MTRQCDKCHKCCDGWLWGEAHGHRFWPGRPCHFVGCNGCSIYENRPHDPCVTFRCKWLEDHSIPDWMKPDLANVIIRELERDGIRYTEVYEAGSRLDTKVLSWLFIEYANGKIKNLKYQLDGGWNFIGTQEFLSLLP